MTRKKREQYEALIESIMIGEIAATRNNPELNNILQSKVSVEKKRMAITSVLDENVKVFNKIRRFVENNNVSRSEFVRYLVEQLKYYVKDGEIEQKKYGEVMTPFSLVNDMLDTLPKEVWNNPDLKWFDPANGVGIFPVIIVERLMKGLEEIIPDEDERYRHIMEEMIYVSELQPRNAFLFLVGFDPLNEFDLNIYLGDSLEEGLDNHIKNEWGVEKFDVIVMNPPYQELKEGFKKSQSIWQFFIEKSLNILKEGGYLVAVHPSGWRNVKGIYKNIQNILRNKQMLFVKFHTYMDGYNTFGAKINFDYYCLKNSINKNYFTNIICEGGVNYSIDLSKVEFIPSENINEVYSLVAKDNEEKVEILYSRTIYGNDKKHMSKIETNEHIFPCVYTVNFKNQPSFHWSNINNGHFGTPKVIWGNGASGICVDTEGKYGVMNFSCAIVDIPENLEKIKIALQSEKFIKEIMMFKNSLGDKYNQKVIATFRKDFWKEFIT